MKKYLGMFVVAAFGGLFAIGLTKLINHDDQTNFEADHLAKFASIQDQGNPDFTAVAELVTPTVVHIITAMNPSNEMGEDPFGGFFKGFELPQSPRSGSGSGVIISSTGIL